jgi:hypothetical protein
MTRPAGAGAMRMMQAVDSMAEILRLENAALEAMDIAAAGGLLAPKHAAADALAEAWRAADADPASLTGLQELGRLAEQNRLLLTRAMRVQRRVLDLVARAAKDAQPQSRYGAAGRTVASAIPPQNLKTRI